MCVEGVRLASLPVPRLIYVATYLANANLDVSPSEIVWCAK